MLIHFLDSIRTKAKAEFLQIFMTSAAQSSDFQNASTPFSVFIHKLQDLLSRAEHFEVVTVSHNAFDNSRSSPAAMLSKQLRLRLTSEEESEVPRSFSNITISVHAIATFKSLDDYLRPRISMHERPRGSRHREGVSNALAAFAAAAGIPHAHHRLADRGGASSDPPSASTPSDAVSTDPSRRKPLKSKKADTAPEPKSDQAKPSASRRSSRRKQASAANEQDPPVPPPERVQTPLECADEHQISDEEEDLEDSSALDAIVDDLEGEFGGEPGTEPTAVNMEVASTGRVTARREDGTRVATPSQVISVPPPQSTPSLQGRDLASGISFSAANRAMSYAAAIQSVPQDWHIEFNIDGNPVPYETTIYQAVHHNDLQATSATIRNLWSAVHTIRFKRVPGPPPTESSLASQIASTTSKKDSNAALPASLHEHPQTSKILQLLNIFHEINTNLDDVLDDDNRENAETVHAEALSQFVNTKLTAKLNRQLEEPLIVASNCLPSWSEDLARLYPFLFPFETRHLFLQSTSFGYSRSMTRWQSQSTEENRRDRHRDDRPFMGKLQRQKVRISRTRILDSACKVMEIYGGSPSILEIEYFDEVGTGLGPTLEFYSTVSKEFSKNRIKMWRASTANEQEEYAFGNNGMFPAPLTELMAESEFGKKVLNYFKMLGKFIARSMLDSRIIDVSLNPTFFRVGDRPTSVPLSLGAVKTVDSQLAQSLKLLKQYASARKDIDSDSSLSITQKAREANQITIKNATLVDLSLDFTLPGYPQIELIENGANTPVTMDNVTLYVDKVIDMTIGSGIQRQVEQFRAGFSEVFPYSALKAFTPNELVMLFGRIEEDWSIESRYSLYGLEHPR